MTFVGYVGGDPGSGLITPPWAGYTDNSTLVYETVLGNITDGVVYGKGVAFDLALMNSIPANVKVACSYQDQYCEYINSADSSGSPYTVEVGAGLNNGYYTAKDSENRICFTSTNASSVMNSASYQTYVNGGGEVFCKVGTYELTAGIQRYNRTTFMGESWVGRSEDWQDLTKGTIFKATASFSSFMFTDNSSLTYGVNTENIIFYDPSDYVTYGLYFDNSVQGLIQGCKFYQIEQGIRLTQEGGSCYQWEIYTNHITGKLDFYTNVDSYGIYIGGSDHRSFNNLIGVYYNGYYINGGMNFFTNDHVCLCKNMGFRVMDTNFFSNCQSENNLGTAVWMYGSGAFQGGNWIGGRVSYNQHSGFRLEGVTDFTISGVTLNENGRETDNTYYDIQIVGSDGHLIKRINIEGNNIAAGDSAGTGNKTKNGVAMSGIAYTDGVNILGNTLYNYASDAIVKAGTNVKIRDNVGYVNVVSGSATILNGTTSVTFAHGLVGTPTVVTLGATSVEVVDARATTVSSSNIIISVSSEVTADRVVYYYAEYNP
jgi:hypothetical protein